VYIYIYAAAAAIRSRRRLSSSVYVYTCTKKNVTAFLVKKNMAFKYVVLLAAALLCALSRGAIAPREGLVLRHKMFNLKLIRPLSRSRSSSMSFLETGEITLTKRRELGSGAFGTVWMCEIQVEGEAGDGFVASMPRVVAAKIMNHIPSQDEMDAAELETGDCAGPAVWPVPVLQMINSFFREAAFAKAIASNSETKSMIGKHFVEFYGLHFLSEDSSSESEEEDDSVMTVQAEGTNKQMAVLLMQIMSNMDDLSCIPSRAKTCHWELTKFVSEPSLRGQFIEHGKKIMRDLLSAVDVLGRHALVHHDIWEDNVVVRAQYSEDSEDIEYTALLIDFGVSIDCNHVPFKTEATICPSSEGFGGGKGKEKVSRVDGGAGKKVNKPRRSSLVSHSSLEPLEMEKARPPRIRRAVSAPQVPSTGFLSQEFKDMMITKYGIDPLVLKLKERRSVHLRRLMYPGLRSEFEDSITYAYSDERCCTNLFRGYFNSYFSRHDPKLVDLGVHSSGMRVCKQLASDEDNAKMDKIMILIMLEKILNLQFGEPRWLDEADELVDKIQKPIENRLLEIKFKWLIDEVCGLRASLHFHESEPVVIHGAFKLMCE
jgi:serine/threonine protein kinase